MFQMNKDKIFLGAAVLVVVITGALLFAKSDFSKVFPFLHPSAQSVAQKSVDYINKNLLPAGQTATLGAVSEQNGVIKIKVTVGGTSYDSYVTSDGKLFFPQAYDLTAAAKTTPGATTTAKPADITKVDKPLLEAYVVSDCPYGLQMQRMMVDAVAKAPALADFIKVRYIGSVSGNDITSMHDAAPNGAEAKENLRQMCIREEQPAKFYTYLGCYMKKSAGALGNGMPIGDSASCLSSTGVDVAKVNSCMADPVRGLAFAKADFALDTKYNVTSSPTLVLDGATISEFDFGGRVTDSIRAMVCAASKTPSAFCSTKLSTEQTATSFSLTYAPAATAAPASSAANCAPAN